MDGWNERIANVPVWIWLLCMFIAVIILGITGNPGYLLAITIGYLSASVLDGILTVIEKKYRKNK